MKPTIRLTAAACLLIGSALGGAVDRIAANSADFVRLTPEQIPWQDIPGGHGAQLATIAGDPADTVQADPRQPFWVQLKP